VKFAFSLIRSDISPLDFYGQGVGKKCAIGLTFRHQWPFSCPRFEMVQDTGNLTQTS